MIYGIGTDIIEVSRIQKAIEKKNGFKEKVFSPNEIVSCEAKGNKYQSYAARFAAKEAFMKAFSSGWNNGISWNEIEILNHDNGSPYLNLINGTKELVFSGKNLLLHVTLSHLKDFATAQVIIETIEK